MANNVYSDLDNSVEPSFREHVSLEEINLIKDTLADVSTLSAELTSQIQKNQEILTEVGIELLSQSTILADLRKQSIEKNEKHEHIVREIQQSHEHVNSHSERLTQLQEAQKFLTRKFITFTSKPAPQEPTPIFSNGLSFRQVVILLAAHGFLVVLVSCTLIHYFPPHATARNEQQWYSIFQRVDRLYKDRFGNKPPAKR